MKFQPFGGFFKRLFTKKATYTQVHGSNVNQGGRQQPLSGDEFKFGSVTYSKKGMQAIIDHEVGSEAYYKKVYHRPTWPKGFSGVTIGIGYDLGQVTLDQFITDWGNKDSVDDQEFELLKGGIGLKGKQAKAYAAKIKKFVSISLEDAKEVFFDRTVPKYHGMTERAFPGFGSLPPIVCSVLLSLVYNRGGSMGKRGSSSWDRRKEMRVIRECVKNSDLRGIATALRDMKRLWVGKGQDGLLKRRDKEASMVLSALA